MSYKDAIKKTLCDNGFKIVEEFLFRFTKEDASTFFSKYAQEPSFLDLINYMSFDDVIVMILEKENAVGDLKTILGAPNPMKAEKGTIRALFGISVMRNVCFGSDSEEDVERELKLFFG